MVAKQFWTLLMVTCSFMWTHPESAEKEVSLSEEIFYMVSSHEISIENFPADEQQVYHQLGPLYQKIYLYAFADEERHRVVVYMSRGLSAYDAMNTILRAEARQYTNKKNPKNNKSIPPSDRAQKNTAPTTIF